MAKTLFSLFKLNSTTGITMNFMAFMFHTTAEDNAELSWTQIVIELQTEVAEASIMPTAAALAQYAKKREYIHKDAMHSPVLVSYIRHQKYSTRTCPVFFGEDDDEDSAKKWTFCTSSHQTSRRVGIALERAQGKPGHMINFDMDSKKPLVLCVMEIPSLDVANLVIYFKR